MDYLILQTISTKKGVWGVSDPHIESQPLKFPLPLSLPKDAIKYLLFGFPRFQALFKE